MKTLKQLENKIKRAETSAYNLYAELSLILQEQIEARIQKELDKFTGKELKKSYKINEPLFSTGMFDDIRKQIEEILEPLKVIIGNPSEAIVDQLHLLGVDQPALDMFQIYRSAYNIHTILNQHAVKPKHTYAWRKKTLKWMETNTANHIDKNILSYSNAVIDKLKASTDVFEREIYQRIEWKNKTKALVKQEMIEAVKNRSSLVQVKQNLKDATKDYYRNWKLIVKTEFAMAKNAGTTQYMDDLAGTLGEDPTVAIIDMDDDRVTEFCSNNSRHDSDNMKYFKYSQLKPAGFNLGKPEKEWENSIPPRHFNCRCWLVWVPTGMKVTGEGYVRPLEKGETVTIEKQTTVNLKAR